MARGTRWRVQARGTTEGALCAPSALPWFCPIASWSAPSDGGVQGDKNTDVTVPQGWRVSRQRSGTLAAHPRPQPSQSLAAFGDAQPGVRDCLLPLRPSSMREASDLLESKVQVCVVTWEAVHGSKRVA